MSEMLITVPGDPSNDEYPAYNNVNVENLWIKKNIYREFAPKVFDQIHTGAIVESQNIRNITFTEKLGLYTFEEKRLRFVVTVESILELIQLLSDTGEKSFGLLEDNCNPGRWILEW